LSRRFLRARAAGVLLTLVAAALLHSPPSQARVDPGLPVVSGWWKHSSRLLQVRFDPPELAVSTDVNVLLPRRYRRTDRRYPVLYLLHGAGQWHRSWLDYGEVRSLTRRRKLIVVLPDAGAYGFYSDWDNGGAGGPPMWETWHLGRLVPWIDSRFRTRTRRSARAIAGVSMGGFGALSYAARRPDLFSAAASFSGAVDTNHPEFVRDFEAAGGNAIWGPRERDEARWRAHNPLDLAANLRAVDVHLFTGNGVVDPVEGMVHEMNVALHHRLARLGIPHRWYDQGPRRHAMGSASKDLAQALPAIMATLDSSRRAARKGASAAAGG